MKFAWISALFILFLGVAIAAGYSLKQPEMQGRYSWTTAVCEGNRCTDFYVECNGANALSVTPVTGMVTFDSDWTDPRGGNPVLCPR
jgi:hypothetical protein